MIYTQAQFSTYMTRYGRSVFSEDVGYSSTPGWIERNLSEYTHNGVRVGITASERNFMYQVMRFKDTSNPLPIATIEIDVIAHGMGVTVRQAQRIKANLVKKEALNVHYQGRGPSTYDFTPLVQQCIWNEIQFTARGVRGYTGNKRQSKIRMEEARILMDQYMLEAGMKNVENEENNAMGDITDTLKDNGYPCTNTNVFVEPLVSDDTSRSSDFSDFQEPLTDEPLNLETQEQTNLAPAPALRPRPADNIVINGKPASNKGSRPRAVNNKPKSEKQERVIEWTNALLKHFCSDLTFVGSTADWSDPQYKRFIRAARSFASQHVKNWKVPADVASRIDVPTDANGILSKFIQWLHDNRNWKIVETYSVQAFVNHLLDFSVYWARVIDHRAKAIRTIMELEEEMRTAKPVEVKPKNVTPIPAPQPVVKADKALVNTRDLPAGGMVREWKTINAFGRTVYEEEWLTPEEATLIRNQA